MEKWSVYPTFIGELARNDYEGWVLLITTLQTDFVKKLTLCTISAEIVGKNCGQVGASLN